MGAQNIIGLGFNIEELTAEKKQVLDLFVDLFGQLKEYDGTRFNPLGNGGLVDLKKSLTDGAAAMNAFGETAKKYNDVVTAQYQKQQAAKKSTDELTLSTNEYKKVQDGLATTQAKSNAASSNAAENLAIEKEQLKQRNAELQAGVKYLLSETGSVLEAKAAISQLTIERNKQNAATEEGKQKIIELNAEIDKNNKFINENTSSIEQQKNNVGNYAESLAPAFDSLKEELQNIKNLKAEIEARGVNVQNFGARTVVQGFGANQHQNQGPTALAGGGGGQASILAQDTEALQKYTLQEKVLEGALQRQAVGFRTGNQEMRNVKNTLDTMALAGLQNTEAFEKLNVAYTANEQKVKDLHREQAILTTDAPALTALTGVARGLGGAYAFGAGASALFSDGNEKLDKELNKLVAVMTFLQGLTEAVSVLKERNAIVTALETEATKALNIVREIEVAIFGKEESEISALTAAKIASTEVTNLNTLATEANAEANVLNTTTMEATVGATIAAEGATVGLRTALVSTGIGAILIAVGIAAGFLISKIIEWNTADERAVKLQGELAEATQKLNETISKEIELLAKSNADQIDALKNQLAVMEAAGLNREKEFATKTKIVELDKQQADRAISSATQIALVEQENLHSSELLSERKREQFDLNEKIKKGEIDVFAAQKEQVRINSLSYGEQVTAENALAKSRDFHLSQYKTALIELQTLQTAQAEEISNHKEVPESLTKRIEAVEKVVSSQKDAAERADALIKLGEATTNAVEVQKTEITKFNEDERRKVVLETAEVEADYVKSKNALILGDDRSTLAQRLAALQSNAEQERRLAEANKDNILSNPGSSSADRSLAIIKASEEERKITASSQDAQYKLVVEYNDKKLSLINDINKNELESDAATQDEISKFAQQELDARLGALKANIADKTKEIINEYNLQISLAKEHNKTQEEIDKIESDKKRALVSLTAATEKEIYDITISYGDRKLKAVQDQNKAANTSNAIDAEYEKQLSSLNKSLLDGNISYSKYLRDKVELDKAYTAKKDAADIADDKAALKRLKDREDAEIQLKLDAAKVDLDAAKAGGDDQEIKNAQAKYNALLSGKEKFDAEYNALNEKLNHDQIKSENDKINAIKSAEEKLEQNIKDIKIGAYNLAKELVDASYENQINKIQTTIEKTDEQYSNEIAAVQRSTISQQQQAEEVIILTAQKNAQDTALKNQQKKAKIDEAKFDRDVAVAEVVWNTAKAIMKDTFGVPFPLSLAVAASDAALGAIQVAAILAKPIPTYGDGIGIPGRGRHPGGEAIVGERWTPEKISIPGYEPFILDKPTLLNLPADSSVLPMTPSELVWEIGSAGMARTAAQFSQPSASGNEAWEIARWQMSQTKRMHERSQRNIINKIVVYVDADWQNYVNKKVLGKG